MDGPVTNAYSRVWFETFLDQIPSDITANEVAFLQRVLPLPGYRHVLDLCCGSGRHAARLTELGYVVTGVDRDPVCLRQATERRTGTTARFIEGDMRDLSGLPGPFDAFLILWQSFGYFDPETNLQVLGKVARALGPCGRLVLDLYHRGFFEAHPGTRLLQCKGLQVEETKWMEGNRLHVTLNYRTGESEAMEWQLFYPEEIVSIAEGVGLRLTLLGSEWEESVAPSREVPRMQIVLEKA